MTSVTPVVWLIVSALVLLLVGVVAKYFIENFLPDAVRVPVLLGAGIVLLLILLLVTLRYFGVA